MSVLYLSVLHRFPVQLLLTSQYGSLGACPDPLLPHAPAASALPLVGCVRGAAAVPPGEGLFRPFPLRSPHYLLPGAAVDRAPLRHQLVEGAAGPPQLRGYANGHVGWRQYGCICTAEPSAPSRGTRVLNAGMFASRGSRGEGREASWIII